MVPEGEERGGKFEDLFEDLDKFFAQGNPAAGGRPAGAGAGGAEEEEVPRAGSKPSPRGTSGSDPGPVPVGPDEELLPPGWEPDIAGLDLGAGASTDIPVSGEESASHTKARTGDRSDQEAGDAHESGGEPEGEMTGSDWSRLRDALGDEKQVEVVDVPSEPSPADIEEELYGYESDMGLGEPVTLDAGPGDEERHELSLEDLKKAPPEYRELPQAEDEESAAEDAEVFSEGDEVAGELPPRKGVPEPPSPEEPYWDEPGIDDVEAAADNLAASFGEAPGVEEELLADIDEPQGPRTVRVGGAEPLSGPTWEEPTSAPLMPDQGGPLQPARNLPAAVLTAAILAAAALISLWVAKSAFAIVASAVVLLGQAELYATMQRKGNQPATALGLVLGGFTLAGAYLKGEQAMLFFVALGLMLSFLWYMAAVPKAREGVLAHIGSTILGVLYVPFLASYILIILAQGHSGRALMLAVLGLTFVYDIAAFLVGSGWGSRPLAPTISPKKSWEGLFGATVVTFALAVAILPSIEPLNLVKSVGLAIVVAVFAPLGDLAESAIKRDLGVKDMGSILPGHGGVLDRIDSVLFVAPAAFYFLRLIF